MEPANEGNEDELDANETLAGGSKAIQAELETAEAEWRARRRRWKAEQWQRRQKEIVEQNGPQHTGRISSNKPALPKVPQWSTTQTKYRCAFCPKCFTKRRFLVAHLKAHSALAHDPRLVMVSDTELNQFSHKLMAENKLLQVCTRKDADPSYLPEMPVGNTQASPATAGYTPTMPLTLNAAPSHSAELSIPAYTALTYAYPAVAIYTFPSYTVSSAFPAPVAQNSVINYPVVDYPLTHYFHASAMGQAATAHLTGQQAHLPAPTPTLEREESDRDDTQSD